MNIANELNNAIQAFIAAPAGSEAAVNAYDGIQQWLAAGYEADGYPGEKIDRMDLASEANLLIERARSR